MFDILCLTSCVLHLQFIQSSNESGAAGCVIHTTSNSPFESFYPLPIGEGIIRLGSRQRDHIADW